MSENKTFSFCPECGSLVSGNYCENCGAEIDEDSIQMSQQTEIPNYMNYGDGGNERKEVKKKSGPKVAWAIALVSVLALFLLVLLLVVVCSTVFLFYSNQIASNRQTPPVAQGGTGTSGSGTQSGTGQTSTSSQTYLVEPLEEKKDVEIASEDIDDLLALGTYSDEVVAQGDLIPWVPDSDIFPYGHTNSSRVQYTGVYYTEWGDSIDYNQEYTVEAHEFSFSGDVNGAAVSAHINYYQFVGDNIPNLDEINRILYENALNELLAVLSMPAGQLYYTSVDIYSDSYIPYNDDVKASVIRYVQIYYDGYSDTFYLDCDNVDLKEGKMLYTQDIIDVSDTAFAEEFVSLSTSQNGSSDVFDYMTDDELIGMLTNDDTNIIFFSPYGLELGMNYRVNSSYANYGWVTITMGMSSKYCSVKPEYSSITNPTNTYMLPETTEEESDEEMSGEIESEEYSDSYDDGYVNPDDGYSESDGYDDPYADEYYDPYADGYYEPDDDGYDDYGFPDNQDDITEL